MVYSGIKLKGLEVGFNGEDSFPGIAMRIDILSILQVGFNESNGLIEVIGVPQSMHFEGVSQVWFEDVINYSDWSLRNVLEGINT